jgi:hypothetical protein
MIRSKSEASAFKSIRVPCSSGPVSGPGGHVACTLGRRSPNSETPMEIKFRHDVDNVLKESKKQTKPVLLDFSAAPM